MCQYLTQCLITTPINCHSFLTSQNQTLHMERKDLGTRLTFELSLRRNTDLTNESSLVPRPFPPPVFDRLLYANTRVIDANVVIEMVSPGFQCHQQLNMANCCAMLCYSQVFGKIEGIN